MGIAINGILPAGFAINGTEVMGMAFNGQVIWEAVTLPLLPPIGTSLNDCSWAEISAIAASGQASQYFAVGDRKAVLIDGTIGTRGIEKTYYVYILGFNYNGAQNCIDFGTFKTALTGGKDICLVDDEYGEDSSKATAFTMNASYTTSGGWKNCHMRYEILGSTNVVNGNPTATAATNPRAKTLMSALPSDLRVVMKPMTVSSLVANEDGGSGNQTTVDYLPLLGTVEVLGDDAYSYYSAGGSTVKYKYDKQKITANWWYRDPVPTYLGVWCAHDSERDSMTVPSCTYSYGIAPIFRV